MKRALPDSELAISADRVANLLEKFKVNTEAPQTRATLGRIPGQQNFYGIQAPEIDNEYVLNELVKPLVAQLGIHFLL